MIVGGAPTAIVSAWFEVSGFPKAVLPRSSAVSVSVSFPAKLPLLYVTPAESVAEIAVGVPVSVTLAVPLSLMAAPLATD